MQKSAEVWHSAADADISLQLQKKPNLLPNQPSAVIAARLFLLTVRFVHPAGRKLTRTSIIKEMCAERIQCVFP